MLIVNEHETAKVVPFAKKEKERQNKSWIVSTTVSSRAVSVGDFMLYCGDLFSLLNIFCKFIL